jgi:exopolysaccharide biosynthesis polyprenyl glycosylphosphotransferase
VAAPQPATNGQSTARQLSRGTPRRGRLVKRLLVVADALGLCLAFLLAELLFAPMEVPVDRLDVATETFVFLATLPGWILIAKLHGLYDRDEERTDHSTADEFVGVLHVVTIGAWIFIAGAWLTGLINPDMAKLMTFWALAIVLVPIGRAVMRALCRQRPSYRQNTVIVGAGEVGQRIAQKFQRHPEYGITLLGFVDRAPRERSGAVEEIPVLGSPDELPEIITKLGVERVVIAFTQESHESTIQLIRTLSCYDVQVDVVPRLFEVVGPNAEAHTVGGVPLIGLSPLRLNTYALVAKRALDLAVSSLALVLLAPAFALVAVAIKVDSEGPVFFRQVRMGAGNRIFCINKFRTMTADAEVRKPGVSHLNVHGPEGNSRMFKVRHDPRVTRVGSLLRRYSLDELPQLINVLRGEMSLVGPRPLILDEDRYVGDWARRRVDLRPGMTGLWQVMGRSEIPFDEMVGLDFLYVTNWSFANDFRLIFRTIPVVLRGNSY